MTDNKYDRQLRLWGSAGQTALGKTCVILIRATAAGTETMKNLVLPGIGSFLVVDDDAPVTDHSCNFFLDSESKKPRAQLAAEYLQELNPDVKGDWKHVDGGLSATTLDVSELVAGKEKVIFIAADCEPPLRQLLADLCWSKEIPMVAVYSYGFIGVVQLQAAPLLLLEPKLRDTVPDLRLTRPFPSLQKAFEDRFANASTWDTMTKQEHGQVPYPYILLYVQKAWKEDHDGKLPTTFAEKQEFQSRVKKMARNYDHELNFQQAVQNAYLGYTPPKKVDLEYLLSQSKSDHDTTLLKGLETFVSQHDGLPPVPGKIPDMAASTALYVGLQELYQKKAAEDWNDLKTMCGSAETVEDEEITLLCRNAIHLDWLQTGRLPTFSTSHKPTEDIIDDLGAVEQDEVRPEHTPLWWYMGFAASQMFWERHRRYPGTTDDYEKDVPILTEKWEHVLKSYGLSFEDKRIAEECTRYGNAEVHNVASIVGGVASQEAVKILTGQYIPVNNTYVFNGIASMGAVYRF